MKHLTDYTGEDALELWGDLLEPMVAIISDDSVIQAMQGKVNKMALAKLILKGHKSEVAQILLRVDDTPLTGMNILLRVISFLTDLGKSEEFQNFFGFAEAERMESVSSGSATANIRETENE